MAKREILKVVSFCDACDKECDWPTACANCGEEFCYKCRDHHTVEYKHGVGVGGYADLHLCLACDAKLEAAHDPERAAYMKIRSLRVQSENFYAEWNKDRQEAEKRVLEFYERREAKQKERTNAQ